MALKSACTAYSGKMLNIVIRRNRIIGSGEDGIQIIDYPDRVQSHYPHRAKRHCPNKNGGDRLHGQWQHRGELRSRQIFPSASR